MTKIKQALIHAFHWLLLRVLIFIALVALVYYAHQVAAALAGDEHVPYPSLALVIVLNSLVVLIVQVLLVARGLKVV